MIGKFFYSLQNALGGKLIALLYGIASSLSFLSSYFYFISPMNSNPITVLTYILTIIVNIVLLIRINNYGQKVEYKFIKFKINGFTSNTNILNQSYF